MRTFQRLPVWAAALLWLAPLSAAAQEKAQTLFSGTLSGNVTFTTDYGFRGYTPTNQDPAIQGGIDWAHNSGFYLGIWGSNIASAGGVEIDFSGGYRWKLGGIAWDFGAVYFVYPDEECMLPNGGACEWEYTELVLKTSYDTGLVNLSLGALFAPGYWGESGVGGGQGWRIFAGAALPLELNGPYSLTLSAAAGFTRADVEGFFAQGENGYFNWDIGAAAGLTSNLELDFRYYSTNLGEAEVRAAGWSAQQADGVEGRFVVRLSYEF